MSAFIFSISFIFISRFHVDKSNVYLYLACIKIGGNTIWVNLYLVGMRVSKNVTFDRFSTMNLIKSLFLVCSGATATNADTVRKRKNSLVKLETNVCAFYKLSTGTLTHTQCLNITKRHFLLRQCANNQTYPALLLKRAAMKLKDAITI